MYELAKNLITIRRTPTLEYSRVLLEYEYSSTWQLLYDLLLIVVGREPANGQMANSLTRFS